MDTNVLQRRKHQEIKDCGQVIGDVERSQFGEDEGLAYRSGISWTRPGDTDVLEVVASIQKFKVIEGSLTHSYG